jgi:hypothetical protein
VDVNSFRRAVFETLNPVPSGTGLNDKSAFSRLIDVVHYPAAFWINQVNAVFGVIVPIAPRRGSPVLGSLTQLYISRDLRTYPIALLNNNTGNPLPHHVLFDACSLFGFDAYRCRLSKTMYRR